MFLDLSPEVTALALLAFGAAVVIALLVMCSGRREELDAGLAAVLPEQKPEQQEDFLSVWTDVLAMPDAEVEARLIELDATTDWAGPGRHRRGVRRQIPGTPIPHQREEDPK
jgi:hypothetical protein